MKGRNTYPDKRHRKLAWIRIGFLILLLIVVVRMTDFGEQDNIAVERQEWMPSQEIGTMERLFEVALAPVGSTMYIWGGGWDLQDAKASVTATQIGMPKKWAEFAQKQTTSYNFREHTKEEEQELGLDCSGYLGWVLYNLFHETDGEEGYVCKSTQMAETLAEKGWGELIRNPVEFLPGDIVSMEGHVWIALGTCEDKSVLLVHSSPPGVSVCGTWIPEEYWGEDEKQNVGVSAAIRLAKNYMKTHHAVWQETYPDRTVLTKYLRNVTVLRWNDATLRNASLYQQKTGEEMMEFLGAF